MAKAEQFGHEVTRQVSEYVVDGVELSLSMDEVNTLKAVLARVSGDPDTSPRKHASNVLHALMDATNREFSGTREYDCLPHNLDGDARIHMQPYK